MSWINLSALWKIVVFGLLAGAGLPAVFAVGMVALERTRGGNPLGPESAGAADAHAEAAGARSEAAADASRVLGLVVAGTCFLLVLAAIGWGIYEIYRLGHK
jgi:hypothetical protein